jgi:hypothetical protein
MLFSKGFSIANTHHQWALPPGHHQTAGEPMEDQNGERPFQFPNGPAGGRNDIIICIRLNKVSDDLAVRLRAKLVALVLQALAELVEVVNIAIVDNSQVTGTVGVGMGIRQGYSSNSSPVGVPDAQGALEVPHLV